MDPLDFSRHSHFRGGLLNHADLASNVDIMADISERSEMSDLCDGSIGEGGPATGSSNVGRSLRNEELNEEHDGPEAEKAEGNSRDVLGQVRKNSPDIGEDEDELDKLAEAAALDAFGPDAAKPDRPTGPMRRSTLVAENSSIDPSWFANRGLMSRRSFEKYKKEQKKKEKEAARENMGLKSKSYANLRSDRRTRRASICGLSTPRSDMDLYALSQLKRPGVDSEQTANEEKHPDSSPQRLTGTNAGHEQGLSSSSTEKTGGLEPTPALRSTKKAAQRRPSQPKFIPPSLDSAEEHEISHPIRRNSLGSMPSLDRSELKRPEPRPASDCNDETIVAAGQGSNSPPLPDELELLRDFGVKNSSSLGEKLNQKVLSSEELRVLGKLIRRLSKDAEKEDQPPFSSGVAGADISQKSLFRPTDPTSSTHESTVRIGSVGTSTERYAYKPVSNRMKGTSPVTEDETYTTSSWKAAVGTAPPSKALTDFTHNIDQALGTPTPEVASSSSIRAVPPPLQCPSFSQSDNKGKAARLDLAKSATCSESCSATTHDDDEERDVGQTSLSRGISTRVNISDDTECRGQGHDRKGPSPTETSQSQIWTKPRSNSTISLESSKRIKQQSLRSSRSSFFTSVNCDDLEGLPLKEDCGDILAEGMRYNSMCLLVNIYSRLRELSVLGHASVKLVDIDVASHQSIARKKAMIEQGLLKPQSEEVRYLETSKPASFVVRTILDENDLMDASHDATLSHLNQAGHTYDASILRELRAWIEESKVKHIDAVTEDIIMRIRSECKLRQTLLDDRHSQTSLSSMGQNPIAESIARRRGSLNANNESFQGKNWLKKEQVLVEDHFGLCPSLQDSAHDKVRTSSYRLSRGVLSDSMIKQAIEDSKDSFFKEGSVMKTLLDSTTEIVWISDRHPLDLIYCICVNRETSTVSVVFKNQEKSLSNLYWCPEMSTFQNPIAHEDYEGNSPFINLRSLAADELLRIRRDTRQSVLHDIRDRIEQVGSELTGGGTYHVSITGHGLGAACATIAGYFFAADTELELHLASAVRVFTYSSAKVGCEYFKDGFRHLERSGRLLHARFTNTNDPAPLLPPNTMGYYHVGLLIRLHTPNHFGRLRTRQALDVSYKETPSSLDIFLRLVRCSLSLVWKSGRISEYQHRLHFAREYRIALGSGGDLRFDRKRANLKTLNDYYLLKCRLSELTDISGKSQPGSTNMLVFIFVSCLLAFEIALVMQWVSNW